MARLVVVLLLCAGCLEPGEVPPRSDGGGTVDAPVALPAADARPADGALSVDGASCSLQGSTYECRNWDAGCAGTFHAGLCPGPIYVQCCVPEAATTCDEHAFPTPNVGLAEAPGEGGCPAGMVKVIDFCIDRYEASLVLVADDGAVSSWSPYQNPGDRRVRAQSAAGAVPQGYIGGAQAAAACAKAGKRLCTDAEWKRACQGPGGTTYPYGDAREWGRCNDWRAEHPAVELFGSVTHLDSPCINQLHDSLDRTGTREGCVTAEGAYDMMGNLHEWTADPAGTFRGGFYVDTVLNGEGCKYATVAHDVYYHDYSTGFRCCAD